MSAPVDVLAVIDELTGTVYSEFTGGNNRDLTGTNLIARGEEARAAVAELIEVVRADHEADPMAWLLSYPLSPELEAHPRTVAARRRAAILARCGVQP